MHFPQPKIIKIPIEHFFKCTPKKFDIVYIDACGSIPSNQHALRCVSSLCKYHRLNSPGIIITNFAKPKNNGSTEHRELKEIMAYYFWAKKYPNDIIQTKKNNILSSLLMEEYRGKIEADFEYYYGEFISATTRDINSVLIPIQRFMNSIYPTIISKDKYITNTVDVQFINSIKNNSLYKFFAILNYINKDEITNSRVQILLNELNGLDGFQMELYDCFNKLSLFKADTSGLNNDIKLIRDYFENDGDIYQFLDKPNSNLFFDLIINQFSYPLHYNSEKIRRYRYTAKQTKMFIDILVLDECRYIYEWLPAIHQIKNAFLNISWQYVFRFALDGLVKQRINYNNEYFFQGSVLGKNVEGFKSKIIEDRIDI